MLVKVSDLKKLENNDFIENYSSFVGFYILRALLDGAMPHKVSLVVQNQGQVTSKTDWKKGFDRFNFKDWLKNEDIKE